MPVDTISLEGTATDALARPTSGIGTGLGIVKHYRGFVLSTTFQPIVAVAQSRVVGAEALLRATDAHGKRVPPLDLFEQSASFADSKHLDQLAHEAHLANFKKYSSDDQWLFLNCRPETLILDAEGGSVLQQTIARQGYDPSQVVIELLEQSSFNHEDVTRAIKAHQKMGFQVAIDDFGIGASNFDRVWGVRPDIVKLDRSLVQRAAFSRDDRRVAKMLVSMLHRMGAMVVAEGVETLDEALAVMDIDVDFVQGYYFAEPNVDLSRSVMRAEDTMSRLWPRLSELVTRIGKQEQIQLSTVRSMLLCAARELEAGGNLPTAAELFFAAPNSLSCFMLDGHGIQQGMAVSRPGHVPNHQRPGNRQLTFRTGSNWSRRAYYRDAVRKPGLIAVYGPHRSLAEGAFVHTAAITVATDRGTMVLCGNFTLDPIELTFGDAGSTGR